MTHFLDFWDCNKKLPQYFERFSYIRWIHFCEEGVSRRRPTLYGALSEAPPSPPAVQTIKILKSHFWLFNRFFHLKYFYIFKMGRVVFRSWVGEGGGSFTVYEKLMTFTCPTTSHTILSWNTFALLFWEIDADNKRRPPSGKTEWVIEFGVRMSIASNSPAPHMPRKTLRGDWVWGKPFHEWEFVRDHSPIEASRVSLSDSKLLLYFVVFRGKLLQPFCFS